MKAFCECETLLQVCKVFNRRPVPLCQAPMGGSKKALTTLGELLQRLLHLLSHADVAAPLLESRGMTPPPLRGVPTGTKTPAPSKHKQPPSGKSSSKKRPAPSQTTGSTPPAKRAAADRHPPPEVPQVRPAAPLHYSSSVADWALSVRVMDSLVFFHQMS